MTPDRIHSIRSSRLSLTINEWGDPAAPPLILQHGGRDQARSWDAVVDAFVGDYRIIAPDLRGHGDSDWVSDGDYHTMDFVYDFANVVDALALPPCRMIGHSLGGNVLLRFAALYPDKVTRFVNIEGLGASPKLRAERDAIDKAQAFCDWIDRTRVMRAWAPKRYPSLDAVAERLLRQDERLSREFADHLAAHATRRNDDGSFSMKYDPAFNGGTIHDIGEEEKRDLWRRVSCPLLFVYGRQSFASDPSVDGRLGWFPGAQFAMFEDAGHWVHHDRLDSFIALTKDFFTE